jgi:protein AroM
MIQKAIGALTIGQSPRPDLVSPLIEILPDRYRVIQAGALDGLTAGDISNAFAGSYPLSTRLQDGTLVMVDESFLIPNLEEALYDLEAQGVVATILLCAGTFSELRGNRPLFKPFNLARDVLYALDVQAIGLVSPIEEQETPIRRRWDSAGFQPTVWTADLTRQDEKFIHQLESQIETNKLECIVLDYVGHPARLVRRLQETAIVPVMDLGQLAMATLAGAL